MKSLKIRSILIMLLHVVSSILVTYGLLCITNERLISTKEDYIIMAIIYEIVTIIPFLIYLNSSKKNYFSIPKKYRNKLEEKDIGYIEKITIKDLSEKYYIEGIYGRNQHYIIRTIYMSSGKQFILKEKYDDYCNQKSFKFYEKN